MHKLMSSYPTPLTKAFWIHALQATGRGNVQDMMSAQTHSIHGHARRHHLKRRGMARPGPRRPLRSCHRTAGAAPWPSALSGTRGPPTPGAAGEFAAKFATHWMQRGSYLPAMRPHTSSGRVRLACSCRVDMMARKCTGPWGQHAPHRVSSSTQYMINLPAI